ncbi:MAG: ABC transporter ATP-binding protein/permease [Lachnospiraceae bacterium]|nr:ABC transporter ATP-binding protein/permease [Lachnospiraceae bacterium]
MKENQGNVALLAILLLVRTVGTIGVAVLLNYVIDTVSLAISDGNTTRIWICAGRCVLYAVGLGLIVGVSDKVKAHTLNKTMRNLREAIMAGVVHMDIPQLKKGNSAQYITLLNQNMTTVEEQYYKNLLSIYTDCVGMVVAVVLLLWIHPIIAVISIAAMAIPSAIPKLFSKGLGEVQKSIVEKTNVYNKTIKDIFEGYEVIKTYLITDEAEKKHAASSVDMEGQKERFAGKMGLVYGLATMASVAVQFFVMSLAGYFAVKGIVTIGSIVAVTQLTGQVISPAFQLSTKISQLKSTKPIQEQIASMVEMEGEEVPVKELEKEIMLENVSFSYEEQPVLDHVNVAFEHGKKYAVVGESGSGKSTLLKLLSGYFGPVDGAKVDGKSGYLCDMTMISQSTFLFDDTIRNNITLYGDFPEEDIREAVHLAGLDSVVYNLDQGMDTPVEENGSRFSGGERQRIAIARAILHKKNVLLLDEITSALDNGNAKSIEENILHLGNTTCISVMHKLVAGILNQYDKILVMEQGKVVEEGTYEELMNRHSYFYNIYQMGAA